MTKYTSSPGVGYPDFIQTTMTLPKEHDPVQHPSHYTQGKVECLDAIESCTGENFEGFLQGQVIKYIWRYRDKNGLEDLKKADFYLQRLIAMHSNLLMRRV